MLLIRLTRFNGHSWDEFFDTFCSAGKLYTTAGIDEAAKFPDRELAELYIDRMNLRQYEPLLVSMDSEEAAREELWDANFREKYGPLEEATGNA